MWPAAIAPFHVHIVVVSLRDAGQMAAAEEIYAACQKAGLDALLDDRDERPGVKFKDADLLGMPVRVTVGNRAGQGGRGGGQGAPRPASRAAGFPEDQVLATLQSAWRCCVPPLS